MQRRLLVHRSSSTIGPPTNIYDSETNREIYMRVEDFQWLEVPSSEKRLVELWNDHCIPDHTPLPDDGEMALLKIQVILANFPDDVLARWAEAMQKFVPELVAQSYTLAMMIMLELIQYFKVMKSHEDEYLDFVEGMSGCQQLSRTLREGNMKGLALDKRYDPCLDLTTCAGFAIWLCAIRRLTARGLFWFGIECKTWVWINRATWKRSKEDPDGDIEKPEVREANIVMERFAFLALLLSLGNRPWVVEQPVSSLFPHALVIKILFGILGAITIRVDHGSYDEEDAPVKPLKLMGGDAPWLPQVARLADNSDERFRLVHTKRFKDQNGKMVSQVHGKKHELSESEHSCQAFTKAVADAYLEWRMFGEDDYTFVVHSGVPSSDSASSGTRLVNINRAINQTPQAEESQIESTQGHEARAEESQQMIDEPVESQIESQVESQIDQLPVRRRPWAAGVLCSR